MTAKTLTLTDFLLARVAEDEKWADARNRTEWHEGHIVKMADTAVVAYIRKECEAKRQMVEWYQAVAASSYKTSMGFLTRLALPYADHPDYREEWRP